MDNKRKRRDYKLKDRASYLRVQEEDTKKLGRSIRRKNARKSIQPSGSSSSSPFLALTLVAIALILIISVVSVWKYYSQSENDPPRDIITLAGVIKVPLDSPFQQEQQTRVCIFLISLDTKSHQLTLAQLPLHQVIYFSRKELGNMLAEDCKNDISCFLGKFQQDYEPELGPIDWYFEVPWNHFENFISNTLNPLLYHEKNWHQSFYDSAALENWTTQKEGTYNKIENIPQDKLSSFIVNGNIQSSPAIIGTEESTLYFLLGQILYDKAAMLNLLKLFANSNDGRSINTKEKDSRFMKIFELFEYFYDHFENPSQIRFFEYQDHVYNPENIYTDFLQNKINVPSSKGIYTINQSGFELNHNEILHCMGDFGVLFKKDTSIGNNQLPESYFLSAEKNWTAYFQTLSQLQNHLKNNEARIRPAFGQSVNDDTIAGRLILGRDLGNYCNRIRNISPTK